MWEFSLHLQQLERSASDGNERATRRPREPVPLNPSGSCSGSPSFLPLTYSCPSTLRLTSCSPLSIPLSSQVRSVKMGPSPFLALGSSSQALRGLFVLLPLTELGSVTRESCFGLLSWIYRRLAGYF